MTSISAIRTGLATRLGTISGLRTAATVPDDPKPPVAIVMPPTVTYDTAMGRGLDTYEFTILVMVGRLSERTAQASLDGYANPSGAGSIKTAIEADRTLGGAASTCRVTDMRNVGPMSIAENTYLTAEFVVTVYA
jgi:hypothetical protein